MVVVAVHSNPVFAVSGDGVETIANFDMVILKGLQNALRQAQTQGDSAKVARLVSQLRAKEADIAAKNATLLVRHTLTLTTLTHTLTLTHTDTLTAAALRRCAAREETQRGRSEWRR